MTKPSSHPDYAATRLRALAQADDDLRRESPALWHFAAVVTSLIHPWASLRLWWIGPVTS